MPLRGLILCLPRLRLQYHEDFQRVLRLWYKGWCQRCLVSRDGHSSAAQKHNFVFIICVCLFHHHLPPKVFPKYHTVYLLYSSSCSNVEMSESFSHNLPEQFNSKVMNQKREDDVDIVEAVWKINQRHKKKTNRRYLKVYLIQLLKKTFCCVHSFQVQTDQSSRQVSNVTQLVLPVSEYRWPWLQSGYATCVILILYDIHISETSINLIISHDP